MRYRACLGSDSFLDVTVNVAQESREQNETL